jgi:hypothetical protein
MEGFFHVSKNCAKLIELNNTYRILLFSHRKIKLATGMDKIQEKLAYGSGTTISESQNFPGKE